MQTGLFFVAMRRRAGAPETGAFPWCVPAIGSLDELELKGAVTLLAGENGTGKSTVLEAMAIGMRAVAAGSVELGADQSLAASRELSSWYRFQRSGVPRAKMFFRAEDVFGFSERVIAEMKTFEAMKEEFQSTLPEGSRGQLEAMGLAAKERAMLASRYGSDPHAKSHGETFLHLLKTRLVPNGLYFLDEPETPLSPLRVLALLVLIHDVVDAGSQFVIATHSPMLLAYPGAQILRFDRSGIMSVCYDELDSVRIMREFLNNPERYLGKLFQTE
jgi:predicted ATPase